ncbi:MAG: hypothetical protein L0229_05405 [Blastocatellia bacterium]|nr:hypothetical protein [Blastocatellia bacterium]
MKKQGSRGAGEQGSKGRRGDTGTRRSNTNPQPPTTDPSAQKAPLVKAEDIAAEIKRQLSDSSIEAIYRDRILRERTRQYQLRAPARAARVEILHTLLGIELKIGNRRLLCPDLATARYLSVFARLGCDRVAVPYDITQISMIADDLESAWHRLALLVEHFTAGRSERLRSIVHRRLIADARARIDELGAGAKFPQFDQKTRQRPRQ